VPELLGRQVMLVWSVEGVLIIDDQLVQVDVLGWFIVRQAIV
jgi:hypothetical protein